jgi:ATP-binding cassette subfamily C protein
MEPVAKGSPVPTLQREIRFQDVDFQYPSGTAPVLEKFSLVISKGETIGLVGATGAGKTTIVDLVLGLLHPVGGTIQIDGIDTSGDWRGWQRQIGYVPQHISLIDASLGENIALGVEPDGIDAERIRRIVSLVRLDHLLARMPEGLDSEIGERGVRLSGGERQRIGIARALYDGRTVLIMDEATSALDNETESAIADAIEQLQGGYTLLIIAHRIRTIRRCDRVVLLKDGKVIDQGNFSVLRERCQEFRQILQLETES